MLDTKRGRRLLSVIHSAALDPTAWAQVGAVLEQSAGNNPTAIYGSDDSIGITTLTWAGAFDPAFIESYIAYYHLLNPWDDIWGRIAKGKTHYLTEELPEDFRKTEFYHDWLRPQGGLGGGAGVRTRAVGMRSLMIGVNIRERDRNRFEAPTRKLLAKLEPHLAHALAVNEMVAELSAKRLASSIRGNEGYSGEDSVKSGGIIVLDQGNQVSWMDSGAIRLLSSTFKISPFGRLSFRFDVAQNWLETISEIQITGSAATSAPYQPLQITVSGERLILRAVHCPADWPASPAFPGGIWFRQFTGPGLVLIVSGADSDDNPEKRLRRKFGLSVAEASIALSLVQGLSTMEIAEARQVSLNTVRNQIQALLYKLGVSTRLEAVRLVAGIKSAAYRRH